MQAGINWSFSPMVDVARDPRWGRVAEGYGEDTYLTSQMAAAVVKGYQSQGMAACVKHFAGYSASEGGRDYNTTWIPELQLRDVYLPPFKAALDAGAMSIMCSFNCLNGLPSSANSHLNIDILRHEWQSKALLVSDWGSGSDLVPHGLAADKKDAALRCVNARMEMDMQGFIYLDYIQQLLDEKRIKEQQIDDCVRSILRIKFQLGLFDNPYVPETAPNYYQSEDLALATTIAEQSAILLKNDGTLPETLILNGLSCAVGE
jgi:beta-glucosidase